MKVNISIDDELMEKIDEYAKKNYTNRSAVFAQATNQFLLTQSVPAAIGEIALAFKKISENNAIDDDSKKKLEEFMLLSRLLGGAK